MNSYIWIHIFMNSYMNSESIHLNSYTHEFIYSYSFHIWIQMYMNSYIHIWIHIVIIWIHMYMNSYMNSYKPWIHIIFSYMNSYVSWIHIRIRVYQGSRCGALATWILVCINDFTYFWMGCGNFIELGKTWNWMPSVAIPYSLLCLHPGTAAHFSGVA